MRLVDADLMKNNIITDNPNNGMEPILKKWIDAQKTVDAIPVAWLRTQINEALDDNETGFASDIDWLIRKYIDEKEVQECSGI